MPPITHGVTQKFQLAILKLINTKYKILPCSSKMRIVIKELGSKKDKKNN
jgi:predicted metallopeptidase